MIIYNTVYYVLYIKLFLNILITKYVTLFQTFLSASCCSLQAFPTDHALDLPQARGKSMSEFVERRQDKSKNALMKSMEAAFNSWVEELRADQAQFCADKILTLNFCFMKLFFFVPSISSPLGKTMLMSWVCDIASPYSVQSFPN